MYVHARTCVHAHVHTNYVINSCFIVGRRLIDRKKVSVGLILEFVLDHEKFFRELSIPWEAFLSLVLRLSALVWQSSLGRPRKRKVPLAVWKVRLKTFHGLDTLKIALQNYYSVMLDKTYHKSIHLAKLPRLKDIFTIAIIGFQYCQYHFKLPLA